MSKENKNIIPVNGTAREKLVIRDRKTKKIITQQKN